LGKKEKVGRASLLVWASSEWAKCTAPPKTFFLKKRHDLLLQLKSDHQKVTSRQIFLPENSNFYHFQTETPPNHLDKLH
jgi:hypothetical protein